MKWIILLASLLFMALIFPAIQNSFSNTTGSFSNITQLATNGTAYEAEQNFLLDNYWLIFAFGGIIVMIWATIKGKNKDGRI